jgi:hypothetical protein
VLVCIWSAVSVIDVNCKIVDLYIITFDVCTTADFVFLYAKGPEDDINIS